MMDKNLKFWFVGRSKETEGFFTLKAEDRRYANFKKKETLIND